MLNEVVSSNKIMGDLCDTHEILFLPEGMDYEILSEEERSANDTSKCSHTDRDKKVLCQFKGVAKPAKRLCKFFQDTSNTWQYVTFEIRLAIQDTSAPTIDIYPNVSRTDHVKDIRKRGHKTVLVRISGFDVGPEVVKNYGKVKLMDPIIKKYCDMYTKDLAKRVGLDDRFLSPIFTTHVFINPMFGLKKRVVNSGILTYDQYQRGILSESCIHDAYVFPNTLLFINSHP